MGDKTAQAWKEEGNAAFRDGDWDLALARYSEALALAKEDGERAVCLKNRAAAHLKRGDHEAALSDCSAALELAPGDPKALYRRCQALEALGRHEEAYRDAKQVLALDPANRSVQPVLQRLFRAVEARAAESAQTGNKVARMFHLVFGPGGDPDKRRMAANNLVVLAREKAGAEAMYREGVVGQAGRLVRTEQDKVVYLACVRVVGELCRDHLERTRGVLRELGVPWFLDVLNCGDEERVNAAQCCLQTVLNSLSGMDGKPDGKPRKELCEQNAKEIDTLLTCLVYSTTSRTFTGLARDAVIELITRNVHYTALDWAERLVAIGGLQRLLEVCSELEEYKYESAMEITASTRTIASVCLARIYENMYHDAARQRFLEGVDGFVKEKLVSPDIESKVRVTVALTSLLLGPLDVGDSVIAREGIMEMVLVMAGTDDRLQQKVACECIIAAASKKDKARPLIAHGAEVLKKLYRSKDDGIRVRALVGLCKLGSSGGTDASVRPFADGSTTKLAEACRRFLVNPDKDKDMRKWAVEASVAALRCAGLSYLTLDAEVKEKLVADRPALQALVELGRTGDHSVVYGVVSTLVNLVNAYEKQELVPEMVELAKYAKHHVPEEHELDDPDFVTHRVAVLAEEGVTSALVAMARTESPNSRELIARVLNAVCAEKELRGLVVQHGGAKALLPLALDGTDKGRRHAAQALARIGITINPEVAFPGQRCPEVVRPLLSLLHQDCSALENFEALLALCNLASVSETVRQRIVKEGGVSLVESYMYEEHEMLRRAATQVMTNLAACPDVVRLYEGPGDRAKFLVLLCADEDEETCAAAAGALATLAAQSKKVCRRVLQAQTWLDSLHHLLLSPDAGLQHRGVALVAHMMRSSRAAAEKLIDTDVMEILLALSVLKEEGREKVSALAAEALRAAETWKLIKKPGEDEDEDLE